MAARALGCFLLATGLLLSTARGGRIDTSGMKFYDVETCREYIPLGANLWVDFAQGAAAVAANLPASSDLASQQDTVTSLFRSAKQLGLNTVRLFGHGDQNLQLQQAPGVYNEELWRGFDYVLAQAANYGIKVIWVAVNNWLDADIGDGKLAYCRWAGLGAEDLFWTDVRAKQLVKNHFQVLVNRTNYFTGIQYKDDPTIFAWNIFNEPRCPASQAGPDCAYLVTPWYNELARYMKTIDGNHMVTTGEEGFFGYNSSQREANPLGVPSNIVTGSYWASMVGQDFRSQHASPDIDFAVAHMWPDNWNTLDSAFPPIWLGNHSETAGSLGKPFLLEEFGKQAVNGLADRTEVYQQTYDALLSSLRTGGAMRGALFWRWANEQGQAGAQGDLTTVYNGDQTYQLIQLKLQELATFVDNGYDLIIPACVPTASRAGAATVSAAGRKLLTLP